jgi:restriction system protein
MIVTFSYLSPGAREVCSARTYPISEVNRDTLKLWLGELRSPGKGTF